MTGAVDLNNERFLGRLRRDMILADYLAGHPVKLIAEKYGVKEPTVCMTARRAGYGPSRNRNRKSIKPPVVDAYRRGVPIKDIVAEFEVDRKSIWVWAMEAGVPLRKPYLSRKLGDTPSTAARAELAAATDNAPEEGQG